MTHRGDAKAQRTLLRAIPRLCVSAVRHGAKVRSHACASYGGSSDSLILAGSGVWRGVLFRGHGSTARRSQSISRRSSDRAARSTSTIDAPGAELDRAQHPAAAKGTHHSRARPLVGSSGRARQGRRSRPHDAPDRKEGAARARERSRDAEESARLGRFSAGCGRCRRKRREKFRSG